ncbi:acyl-CoA dehydrogenase family protein [Pacificimonas sp. ICDLI1SI03]
MNLLDEARDWLTEALEGRFADVRGITDLSSGHDRRREWEKELGAAGLAVIGWPKAYGGRGATIAEQVDFAQQYSGLRAPSRIAHIGVELAGPTIIAFGTEEQKQRFLPPIAAGTQLWAQGYSEPNAGSDLANVRTRARLQDGKWVLDGQKIWTSLGMIADWAFVVARTEEGSKGPKGLSYLLVPLDQPGVTIRPIRQMTGEAEFAEMFFDGATTDAANIVGEPGQGWGVAMATLGFERGVSTVVQQMQFANELQVLIDTARENGWAEDPVVRQRIADAWIGLQVMRHGLVRTLSDESAEQLSDEGLTSKLYWSRWRRGLGDLAMDVQGLTGEIGMPDEDYRFGKLTQLYLSSRADTIYAGTSQIQRNLIAERGLGLPREPRGTQ